MKARFHFLRMPRPKVLLTAASERSGRKPGGLRSQTQLRMRGDGPLTWAIEYPVSLLFSMCRGAELHCRPEVYESSALTT